MNPAIVTKLRRDFVLAHDAQAGGYWQNGNSNTTLGFCVWADHKQSVNLNLRSLSMNTHYSRSNETKCYFNPNKYNHFSVYFGRLVDGAFKIVLSTNPNDIEDFELDVYRFLVRYERGVKNAEVIQADEIGFSATISEMAWQELCDLFERHKPDFDIEVKRQRELN